MTRAPYSPPLLITMDLEIAYDHIIHQQVDILDRLNADMVAIGAPMTTFTTAESTKIFSDKIRMLHDSGHEIGCHGKTHSIDENFEKMSLKEAKAVLDESTQTLKNITGQSPQSFRGPRMETSLATQRALIDLGYESDYSVSSRRIYIPPKPKLFFAPQKPYYSHEKSPHRRGSTTLLNVPLTSFFAPFLSGLLYIVGLKMMKRIFDFYYQLCTFERRPIVYLFHSYEGTDGLNEDELIKSRSSNAYFSEKPIRQKLYRFSAEEKYLLNIELLRYMTNYRNIRPMTASSFAKEFHSSTI